VTAPSSANRDDLRSRRYSVTRRLDCGIIGEDKANNCGIWDGVVELWILNGYSVVAPIVHEDRLISAAKDELSLVLSFFPRVESKSSVVLAIDTGMLAFLATNAPPFDSFSKLMLIVSAATVILLAASIAMLYRGSFPSLKGGEASLVYFREIAKLREHQFIERFRAQDEKHYTDDLLSQAWRNSQILKVKFDCLKWAFTLMALAIPPWIVSVGLFVAYGGHSTLLKH
jgi:hypothetical protein